MSFRFRSHQRLKDSRSISYVFENGKKFHYYPLLFVFADLPPVPGQSIHPSQPEKSFRRLKIGFSVSKKKMRRAVDRNRTKRLMREAYRLQQHTIRSKETSSNPGATTGVMVLYIGHELPEYSTVYKAMGRFLERV